MSSLPTEIPVHLGSTNVGISYEQHIIMYLAAALAQDETCADFWMVSNPAGFTWFDDIVLRKTFTNGETIAVFIEVKQTKLILGIKFGKKLYVSRKRIIFPLDKIKTAFQEIMESRMSWLRNSDCYGILENVDYGKRFFCILTTSNNVEPKPDCYPLSDHPLRFMDASQRNVYQQFGSTIKDDNADLFNHLFLLTGQPDHSNIISAIQNTLGERHFTPKNVNELKRKIEIYMVQDRAVVPLTKITFQALCFEVIVDDWVLNDFSNIGNVDFKYIELWKKIFSSRHKVICIQDYATIRPLLVRFYQLQIHTGPTLSDLIFSLWREGVVPLAIQPKHRDDFIDFLEPYYNHLENKFLIFGNDYVHPDIDVLINVSQLSDDTLEDILEIEVSLQGRALVRLSDIGLLSLQDIKISRLLSWTESGNHNIIGEVITKPDDNYRQRRFVTKEDNRNIHTSDIQHFRRQIVNECELKDISEDIIIVETETGMGKTEFLRSLAYTYDPSRVVVFINLGTCNKDIENNRIGPDGLAYFLNKANPTFDSLITSAFYQDQDSVRTLFLDDYHEILPKHRNKIKCLLEEMLSRNKIRLFISTNNYNELKKDLPRARCKVILNFLPITDAEQPSELDRVGWTPLHFAAESGQVDVVKKLLAERSDTHLETVEDGWTPLHSAARKGHLDIVELLVTKHIDVDKQTDDGSTALMIASSFGYIRIVDLLLASGADPSQADEDGKIALHFAAENGRLNIVEKLLTKCSKPEDVINRETLDGFTAITLASAYGYVYVVNVLLENGADASQLNEDEWCALHFAAENGHLDVVKILALKNIDITQRNLDGDTALTLAAASGHIDIVDFLLENNTDPLQSNRYGCNALHLAAEHGHLDIVQLLLSKGVDVNLKTNGEFTAITLASACGHVDVVDFLLSKEANPFLSNRHGENSINIAARNGHLKVLDLLSRSIDVTHKGSGAIIKASEYGRTDVI